MIQNTSVFASMSEVVSIDAIGIPIALVGRNGRIKINKTLEEMLGGLQQAQEAVPALTTQGKLAFYTREGGSNYIFEVAMTITPDKTMYVFNDKTDALTDALTGALSRRFYELDIIQAVQETNRYTERKKSLLLFDGDKFKDVNDNHGHEIGDQVLQWITTSCKSTIRVTDRFYRIGGDEFAMIAGSQATDKFVKKIITYFNNHDCTPIKRPFSCSIGVADISPGMSVEELKSRADTALYAAKDQGGNCFVRYTEPSLINTIPDYTCS